MKPPACISSLILLLPAVALASEQEHAGEHHGIPWATLLFSAINFAIFLGVLSRYVYPALRSWAFDRHLSVVKTLEEAAQAKNEAEALRAQWESKLATLEQELESMRARARADVARERDQVLAEARRTADAIRTDAQHLAAQEARTAQMRLRDEVARRALEIAQGLAAQRLTAADQEKFLRDFVSEVSA